MTSTPFEPVDRSIRIASLVPMRDRVAAAVATLALLSMANAATAHTVFLTDGGSGDSGFVDRCPANQYVVGLAGRAGAWIDRIQIICAPLLADRTHGATYYGPARGGSGGGAIEFSCAADSVASGVRFYLDSHVSRVTRVDLSCGSIQANRPATVIFQGEPTEVVGFDTDNQQCPNGELASGLAGRVGSDVNALGLLCDARVTAGLAPAPAPAPSRYPIRLTGKATLSCPSGFVWRNASPADRVCVTPMERRIAAQENAAAASHVDPSNQTYGPNTCVQGYVWREAYSGDVVCVTPQQRDAAAAQNQSAPAQIPTAPL